MRKKGMRNGRRWPGRLRAMLAVVVEVLALPSIAALKLLLFPHYIVCRPEICLSIFICLRGAINATGI